jgi:hypothetical protein
LVVAAQVVFRQCTARDGVAAHEHVVLHATATCHGGPKKASARRFSQYVAQRVERIRPCTVRR